MALSENFNNLFPYTYEHDSLAYLPDVPLEKEYVRLVALAIEYGCNMYISRTEKGFKFGFLRDYERDLFLMEAFILNRPGGVISHKEDFNNVTEEYLSAWIESVLEKTDKNKILCAIAQLQENVIELSFAHQDHLEWFFKEKKAGSFDKMAYEKLEPKYPGPDVHLN